MSAGRVVQQGTFDDFAREADGVFARLVARQLA